ncbi:hypothetical protein [Mycoplasma struthionis]|uniref:Variable surface lipoprotein n=1 Tax=Mycoplasma struthionis TaxID=538220 RepID=A0A3G8LHQ7_9MOLU|nr:hypothetical protein [Mycoplasma struthionis]AZG68877.1 hypothetical protein EGN60_02855 [Mycoplasma struthionis]
MKKFKKLFLATLALSPIALTAVAASCAKNEEKSKVVTTPATPKTPKTENTGAEQPKTTTPASEGANNGPAGTQDNQPATQANATVALSDDFNQKVAGNLGTRFQVKNIVRGAFGLDVNKTDDALINESKGLFAVLSKKASENYTRIHNLEHLKQKY